MVVTYEAGILAYREADESLCLVTLAEAFRHSSEQWSFFIVQHSSYAQQMVANVASRGITHFAFMTTDTVLDVIACEYPTVVAHEESRG